MNRNVQVCCRERNTVGLFPVNCVTHQQTPNYPYPFKSLPVDNITTEEAELCHLRGLQLLVDTRQQQPVHLLPAATSTLSDRTKVKRSNKQR